MGNCTALSHAPCESNSLESGVLSCWARLLQAFDSGIWKLHRQQHHHNHPSATAAAATATATATAAATTTTIIMSLVTFSVETQLNPQNNEDEQSKWEVLQSPERRHGEQQQLVSLNPDLVTKDRETTNL